MQGNALSTLTDTTDSKTNVAPVLKGLIFKPGRQQYNTQLEFRGKMGYSTTEKVHMETIRRERHTMIQI